MGPEYSWMGGMWMFPVIFIVVLIIIGHILFYHRGYRPPFCGKDRDFEIPESALDILKKRYAKGEISKVEYEEMKKDIS